MDYAGVGVDEIGGAPSGAGTSGSAKPTMRRLGRKVRVGLDTAEAGLRTGQRGIRKPGSNARVTIEARSSSSTITWTVSG